MHSFHFKGFSGFLLMLICVGAMLFLFIIFPSMVFTALWNALIYEALNGVKIGLFQGGLIWGMVCISLMLLFQPKLQLKMGQLEDFDMDEFELPPPEERKPAKPPKPEKKVAEKAHYSEHWHKWRKVQESAEDSAAQAKNESSKSAR